MFPLVLTEAQARQAVNLPPPTGSPDSYTDRVEVWVLAVTELIDARYRSTDPTTGEELWPTTADLPASVTRAAEIIFRDNWSVDVGAHSQSFGPDRYEGDALVGPAWVIGRRAEEWLAPWDYGSFA